MVAFWIIFIDHLLNELSFCCCLHHSTIMRQILYSVIYLVFWSDLMGIELSDNFLT